MNEQNTFRGINAWGVFIAGYLLEGPTELSKPFISKWIKKIDIYTLDKFEVDPVTVGRCSGKKDSAGILIFEGDIITYEGLSNAVATPGMKRRISTPFVVTYVDCFFNISTYCTCLNRVHVIGNIHQHPELLK